MCCTCYSRTACRTCCAVMPCIIKKSRKISICFMKHLWMMNVFYLSAPEKSIPFFKFQLQPEEHIVCYPTLLSSVLWFLVTLCQNVVSLGRHKPNHLYWSIYDRDNCHEHVSPKQLSKFLFHLGDIERFHISSFTRQKTWSSLEMTSSSHTFFSFVFVFLMIFLFIYIYFLHCLFSVMKLV